MGPSTTRRRTPLRSLAALAAAFVAVHKGLSFVPVLRTSSHSGLPKVSQAEHRRSVALRARGGEDDEDDDDDDYEFPGAAVVLELLTPGQEVEGVVTRVQKFGAFVDIGADKEGLVPISYMSRERVENPEDVVKEGQGVKVWVVSTEVADGKVQKYALSMVKEKAMRRPGGGGGGGGQRAPENVDLSTFEAIDSDTWLSGTVVSMESYGAFVTLKAAEDGPEAQGLLHVSQIRDGFVESVDKELSVDQEVQVRILGIDTDAKRISLTMKSKEAAAGGTGSGGGGRQAVDLATFELVPDTEWLPGSVVTVQDFGAFVSVAAAPGGQEAQGLVHISELQDTFVDDIYSVVSEGQEVKVRVKGVENGKLSLSMKTPGGGRSSAPSKEILEEFENIPNTEWLPGVVKNFQDFGAFVEVTSPSGSVLDGLVHISQITDEERVEDPQEWLEIDQEVKVRILKVDGEKVSLSMVDVQKEKQPEDA